ncbi:Alpha/Beta hydrolase protein [Xylariaceae sp. FL0662B]|nr:Alpha/Beta hydrolase protein [Xylariaceae sp. FL0662B]
MVNHVPGSTLNTTDTSCIKPLDAKEGYVNPAERSPRWLLSAHALALRIGAKLTFNLANLLAPRIPHPTKTIWLNSTLGQWQGKHKISVDIWVSDYVLESPRPSLRPAVINFHGGGFVLGQGADDARWAAEVMAGIDAVVFSVNYRLAPDYPFPTPIEDGADAIMQILEIADEYHVDTNRVIIYGFSAGGTAALGSWAILQDPRRWGYQISHFPLRIAGLKRQSCKRPDLTLPSNLTDLMDASYIYPALSRRERNDVRLSPGLMPGQLLNRLPPVHLCLCEYDMLLTEGIVFAERLRTRGKTISVSVVNGEKHAWDKPPPLAPKETVGLEYGIAVGKMKEWLYSNQ